MAPLHDVAGDGAKGLRLLVEDAERRDGVIHQRLGPPPRFLRTQQTHECRLAGRGVLAHGLAEIGLRAFMIEQVVGDLERKPDAGGVVTERRPGGAVFLREDGAGLAGEVEQRHRS